MANSLLYGFVQLKDLANQRAITVESGALRDAVFRSTAAYNAEVNTLINLFCARGPDYKLRFRTPTNNRLQPADENSRPLPIKLTTYDVELPIQMGQTAWGANAVSRAKMTVQDVNDYVATMYVGDRNWVADHILAALFYNAAGWSHTDPQYGTLTVKGLANSDTVLYGRASGVPATDTHYLAQAAAIADATNPFPTIYTELTEHPENAGGQVVSFVNSAERGLVEALATFRPLDDPNVREASTLSVVTGDLGVNLPGAGVFGRVANQWVAQWDRVPATYVLSVAIGGVPPLRMREDPEAELQGFGNAADEEKWPFEEHIWQRRAGWGSWNRVGAVVTRTGNGSYAIPTSFGSPMA